MEQNDDGSIAKSNQNKGGTKRRRRLGTYQEHGIGSQLIELCGNHKLQVAGIQFATK